MNTNLKLLLVIVSMSFSPVTQSDAIGSGELQYVGSASSKPARGRQVYLFDDGTVERSMAKRMSMHTPWHAVRQFRQSTFAMHVQALEAQCTTVNSSDEAT